MILRAKAVCEKIFKELSEEIGSFDESPRLLAVVIGNDPASVSYARAKGRKAEALGARFECLTMPRDSSQEDAESELVRTIREFAPAGVIIETPIPKHIDFAKLADIVPPIADVDCQRLDSLGKLLSGTPLHIPATAGAVLEILKYYNIPLKGKDVVVVGRSLTVGLPLSLLMLRKSDNANATVTVCHSRTAELEKHCRRAKILIVAAGKPKLINADMVAENVTVIDVGTNYIDGKLIGDVDFESVVEKAAAISPVPGGVGPVTTAFLLKNLISAYKLKTQKQK